MGIKRGFAEEFKKNGLSAVVKRLFYYIPNHYLINKVKKASLSKGINDKDVRTMKIIVSMTSYPKRFENIYWCLKSLLLQSVKPDRIILWLGSDTKESDLTDRMMSLTEYGVEYRFDTERDLKPHKKYFYAVQEFPEDIVITVDDDVVYPHNFIRSLINKHNEYPDAVCARRVHKIASERGQLKPYDTWEQECTSVKKPSKSLVAIGVGGILYPPHCLDKTVTNVELINELSLCADDLWLKTMEILKSTKVVWVPCFFVHPPALEIEQSLWQGNVDENRNDVTIKRLVKYFNLDIKESFED